MFHRHRWVSIAAQKMQQWYESALLSHVSGAEDITKVLQRCECEKLRTITLSGHWTLEQVTEKGAPR